MKDVGILRVKDNALCSVSWHPEDHNLYPRPRPIKITFNEPKSRDSLLKNARKLKDSVFRTVGISADKTKKEREEELQTRKDFTVRKLQGEDKVLYRGQIYDRSEAPWLRRNQKASSLEHVADDDQTEVWQVMSTSVNVNSVQNDERKENANHSDSPPPPHTQTLSNQV